ncbi:D-2-hydroxyacid dehydrogenase [Lacibacterium aquatile]|uniref:D-2-hydroxyacid dehydrogenase n=1 Tax=Lacibacterium aquatile TaxID=1168082 RepID=A0ABW5DPB3_9PROT
MKTFVYAYLDDRARTLILDRLPDAIIVDKHSIGPEDRARFADCEVCFGNVPADWIPGSALRWLQLESIGFEYYRAIADRMSHIAVSNLKGMFAEPAAETALAGLLSLYRGLDILTLAQKEQRWMSLEMRERMGLIAGQKVVIFGLGSIGGRIRDLLQAFGCEVTSFARTAPEADFRDIEALDAVLGQFDIVVSALPNTAATTGIFDRARLDRFKQGAIFVNVGRGSAVDEAALLDGLTSGHLGGAVLDVHLQEPLPPGHPLWSAPRTILTQHTGGGYADELIDKTLFFLGNFEKFETGQPLHNLVDLAQGY